MTRRDQIYKWCIYALGLFPIWVLDAFVLSRYPLLGITPTLLPLAVSAVAVPEFLWSLCWMPLVYLIFRSIFRRVGGTRLA